MADWDRRRSKLVLVENVERAGVRQRHCRPFGGGKGQPHSSKQERRHSLPNKACGENVSVLCPCNRISLQRQLNVGLTITLSPRESGDVSSTLGGIAAQMLDTDDLALWYALNRLLTNYWADVDSNGPRQEKWSMPSSRDQTRSVEH